MCSEGAVSSEDAAARIPVASGRDGAPGGLLCTIFALTFRVGSESSCTGEAVSSEDAAARRPLQVLALFSLLSLLAQTFSEALAGGELFPRTSGSGHDSSTGCFQVTLSVGSCQK